MWLRNLAVFVALVCAMLVFFAVLDAYPHAAHGRLFLAATVLVFLAGGAAFLTFGGDFWARAGLTSLAPAVGLLLGEIAFGSELAFPGFSLALAGAAAAISFLGSILLGGPAYLWKRRRR